MYELENAFLFILLPFVFASPGKKIGNFVDLFSIVCPKLAHHPAGLSVASLVQVEILPGYVALLTHKLSVRVRSYSIAPL